MDVAHHLRSWLLEAPGWWAMPTLRRRFKERGERAATMSHRTTATVGHLACLLGLAALIVPLALGPSVVRGAEPPAELVVRNAKILTVDPKFSTAQAAAIRGGVFVAVGTDAE